MFKASLGYILSVRLYDTLSQNKSKLTSNILNQKMSIHGVLVVWQN